MTGMERFYLLDGHAIAYRQFFGLRVEAFSTSAGQPTNAIYGFARLLLDILGREKPQYLAVSFDRGMSGREDIYPEYKSTREKMPDELASQLPIIEEMVAAFNIPLLILDGFEADDIIGSVCSQLTRRGGIKARIITGDRDLLQLLNDQVEVQLPQRGGPDQVYDVATFHKRYELTPEQLVDLKALMGDSSDNIPGVRGIGQKTATKLLHTYGDLKSIYEHIDEIRGANQRKLREGRELAFLSYDLAQIRHDVPLELDIAASVAHDYDYERVLALFRELEFRTLTRQLQKTEQERRARADSQLSMFAAPGAAKESAPAEVAETESNITRAADVVETIIVQDETALAEMIDALEQAEAIAWDVESTGVDPTSAELVGISLAISPERGYYLPVGHDEGEQLPLTKALDALQPALTDARIGKIAYNANYDYLMLARYGIEVQPVQFDVMLAEWCVNPAGKFSSPTGLKALALHRLGR